MQTNLLKRQLFSNFGIIFAKSKIKIQDMEKSRIDIINYIKDFFRSHIHKEKTDKNAGAAENQTTVFESLPASIVVMPLLRTLNIIYEIENTNNEHELVLRFRFQDNMFILKANRKSNEITIEFPDIYTTNFKNLNAVKKVCNSMNFHTRMARLAYDYNQEKDEISVWSIADGIIDTRLDNQLVQLYNVLQYQFQIKNLFAEYIEKYLKDNPEPTDPLFAEYKDNCSVAMLMEHSIATQPKDVDYRFGANDNDISVSKLIYMITENVTDKDFRMLKVVTDEVKYIKDAKEIAEFDVLSPMIEGKGAEARVVRNQCEMYIQYQDMMIPVIVQLILDDNQTIYYRLSVYQPDTDINPFERLDFKVDAISVVVAYERTTERQRKAEFEYMWKDVQDKIKEGKIDELTNAQKAIYNVNNSDCASDLYWGEKQFEQKRYFETVLHLENVFKHLQIEYENLNKESKQLFYSTCLRLGFCYNEMHMHKKALFYLEICANNRQLNSTIEYINTLVSSKDFRALKIIQMLMENVKEQAHGKNADRDFVKFFKFLLRMKGTALINNGKLDEAEKLFRKMVADPDNRSYAMKELDHIESLKSDENSNDNKNEEK